MTLRIVGTATFVLQDENGRQIDVELPYRVAEDVEKGTLLLVAPPLKDGDPPQVVKMAGLE